MIFLDLSTRLSTRFLCFFYMMGSVSTSYELSRCSWYDGGFYPQVVSFHDALGMIAGPYPQVMVLVWQGFTSICNELSRCSWYGQGSYPQVTFSIWGDSYSQVMRYYDARSMIWVLIHKLWGFTFCFTLRRTCNITLKEWRF